MGLPIIHLEGQILNSGHVSCDIEIDTGLINIQKGELGPMMSIPCKSEVSTWNMNNLPSCYKNTQARLLTLQGILGTKNGVWRKQIPTFLIPDNGQDSFIITFPIEGSDIDAIEDLRDSRELILSIYLSGTVRLRTLPIQGENTGPFFSEVITVKPRELLGVNQQKLIINRDDWIKLIKGLEKTRWVVELPALRLQDKIPIWEEAISTLRLAEDQYHLGYYRETFQKCREVLEGIVIIISKQWNVKRQGNKKFSDWAKELTGRLGNMWPVEDKEQAEVLGSLLSTVWAWTSASHHYGRGVATKDESMFLLHLTTNLLLFATQLLNAHPQYIAKDE